MLGIYISSSLSYNVIEKTSTQAFQALWIEIQFLKKTNIISGVIYRQHNSPDQFKTYFDEISKKSSAQNKSIYVMGDFTIDLLFKTETCDFY